MDMHATKDGPNHQNLNILSGLVEFRHSFYLLNEINSSVWQVIYHSKVLLTQNQNSLVDTQFC